MDLQKKRIAVAGVSSDESKYGSRIFRDLLAAGYDVAGINPRGGSVLGRKLYKDLREMEYVPDVVVMVVPPLVTEKLVDVCAEKGVKEIWMQPGSESGTALEKAEKRGIKVTAACIMITSGVW
ncbi:MAG: CoA-binding protein [Endomicrobiales bacterium]